LRKITPKQTSALLISLTLAAVCGIIYELVISSISSYLLGNSVYQFSITIGVFMFAMGIGSLTTKYFDSDYIENFIIVELSLALIGGLAGITLFLIFPYAREYYEAASIILIIVIGALVGMEIPLLTTAISEIKSTKTSIAEVMGFDYIGALVGSVLFPIILLPKLGLIETSFLIGFINLLISFFTIFTFRDNLRKNSLIKLLSVIVFLALSLGIIFSTQLTKYAEKHLYFDHIIYSQQTEYQKLTFTKSKINSTHKLFIDGHIQFSSKDEFIYHEFLTHPLMGVKSSNDQILILGGGDGLALREVLKYKDVKSVTLVDIDNEMLEFGKKFWIMKELNDHSFTDPKVKAISMDAFTFLNQKGPVFDKVIIDMPDPHNVALNKLYTEQFYKLLQKRISPNGVIVTQASSPFFTRNTFWSIEKTIKAVFSNVLSYNKSIPSFGIWGFHIASNNSLSFDKLMITENTKSIDIKSLKSSTIFSKDISKPKHSLEINTLMKPTLFMTYNMDLGE
jgi:spermidine synthase